MYKAHGKTGTREAVAVKCVLKSQLCKAEVDNIITEISLLKRLKHPHIVEMKDFAWDANYIYIIMDYYGGGDLSRFIKSRSVLAEDVVKKFLQQLALALREQTLKMSRRFLKWFVDSILIELTYI